MENFINNYPSTHPYWGASTYYDARRRPEPVEKDFRKSLGRQRMEQDIKLLLGKDWTFYSNYDVSGLDQAFKLVLSSKDPIYRILYKIARDIHGNYLKGHITVAKKVVNKPEDTPKNTNNFIIPPLDPVKQSSRLIKY